MQAETTSSPTARPRSAPVRWWPWLEAGLVLLLAIAIRLPGLWQEGAGDELYHVLAARQYRIDGTFRIHGGEAYNRAWAFTLLVAGAFRLLGESLFVARLPSAVFGAACAAVVFLWLRLRGERTAAWAAGLLVCVDPELVKASQLCRFYPLQHLLFLLGCTCASALAAAGRSTSARLALGAGGGLSLWLATQLQIVTWIGIAGLASFLALTASPSLIRALARRPALRWAAAGVTLALAAGLALAIRQGLHQPLVDLATYVDSWAQSGEKAWRYYHGQLLDQWPTLWSLFPVSLLVAASLRPRLALLCGCVFGTAFLVHSFLAWKAYRYFSYALPFFFVVSGLAVAGVLAPLRRVADEILSRSPWLAARPRRRTAMRSLALAAAALFVVASNRAVVLTARSLGEDQSYRHPGMTSGSLSWVRAAEALAPALQAAEVVVTTDDLKAIYYLGRVDYVINRDHQLEDRRREDGPRPEFALDTKIATPLVSSPDSIRTILACHPSGLVVAQDSALATPFLVPPETAAFLLAQGERIPLPAEWGITALRWSNPSPLPARSCPRRR